MCTLDDAMNWKKLVDASYAILNPDSECHLNISENWFPSYIAVSYIESSTRKITYANQLKEQGSINMTRNYVRV